MKSPIPPNGLLPERRLVTGQPVHRGFVMPPDDPTARPHPVDAVLDGPPGTVTAHAMPRGEEGFASDVRDAAPASDT